MSTEEFDKHKESVATQRLEKPKTLGGLSSVLWNEISLQQYNFDRANVEVAYLRTITQDMILRFFKEVVFSEGRHKLSVHIISTAEGGAGTLSENDAVSKESCDATPGQMPKKIEDIMSFKISQSLYPLLQPFQNIPRKGARSSKL